MRDHDNVPAPALPRWRLRPIWFGYLGLFGLLSGLHPSLAPLRVLWLGSLIYLVLLLAGWLRARFWPSAPTGDTPPPPLPRAGPTERRGAAWALGRSAVSLLLAVLNPRLLAAMLLQLGGQVMIWLRWRGRLPTLASYRSRVRYTVPVQGAWLVYNGGVTPDNSHSWDILTQRYAYDLVVADAAGRRHPPGQGAHVAEYFAYNQAVVAPADGEVVRVRDGVRDAPAPGSGWLDWLSADFRGNFVVIKHAPAEYSVLSHLIAGRIAVRAGQQVRRGALIGHCGNSGHSLEPHLHVQLQDHANFFVAMGLPLRFDQVVVNDGPAGEAVLRAGMRVRQQD